MMAEQYQFGGRFHDGNDVRLEHYRLQIHKLKELNLQQAAGYQKKIQSLQKMLKGQGFNSAGLAAYHRNQQQAYQSASNINTEILKRDKEINRLSEQNQRLRKHGYMNPDHNLIAKRKGYFDQVADKDAQIIRLKKTIYQLQTKYDGKYYNDARIRNQYTILQKQNENLRKQLQSLYSTSTNKKVENQIDTQLLQGIKYKKQRDLLEKQLEHLKTQYKKLDYEFQNHRNTVQNRVGSVMDAESLRRDLYQSNLRNLQLMQYLKTVQNTNMIRQSNINNNTASKIPFHLQTQPASPRLSNQASPIRNTNTGEYIGNSSINHYSMAQSQGRSRNHNIFGPRNTYQNNHNQIQNYGQPQPLPVQQIQSQIVPQSPMMNQQPYPLQQQQQSSLLQQPNLQQMQSQIQSPMQPPMQSQIQSQMQSPMQPPMQSQMQSPMQPQMQSQIQSQMQSPMQSPMQPQMVNQMTNQNRPPLPQQSNPNINSNVFNPQQIPPTNQNFNPSIGQMGSPNSQPPNGEALIEKKISGFYDKYGLDNIIKEKLK